MPVKASSSAPNPFTRLGLAFLVVGIHLLWFCAAASPLCADDTPRPPVSIRGAKLIDAERLLALVGPAPQDPEILPQWGMRAVTRIESHYRARDYDFARAWFSLAEDGTPTIVVDEGVMDRIIFHGVNTYDALVFRLVLDLPGNVFHGPSLDAALQDLKARYNLVTISYRVDDTGMGTATLLGHVANLRILNVFILTKESFGYSFSAQLDPTYGLLPRVGLRFRDMLWDDDRFQTKLELSVPYRRYFFDAEPKFQWVRGLADLSYRAPPFFDGLLAPEITAVTSLSNDARTDVGLEDYFTYRAQASANLGILWPDFSLTPGLAVNYTLLFAVTEDASRETPAAATDALLRLGGRLAARLNLYPEVSRRDLLSEIKVDTFFGGDVLGAFFTEVRLEGQGAVSWGLHDFLVRGRGVLVAGDVKVSDEVQLASDTQRVYFGSRYWVRQAFSLEVAARFALWRDRLKVGLFHDVSIFGDRSSGPERFALANAFGPSLHVIFFDQFALDLHYGFGFASVGFDHNLSLRLYSLY